MSVFGDSLFHSNGAHNDLASFFRSRVIGGVTQDVDRITPAQLAQHSDADLARPIAERHAIKPLTLHMAKSKGDVTPTTVTSRNEFNEHFVTNGFMVRKTIPFDGEKALFRYQPGTMSSAGWPKGSVIGDSVCIGMDVAANATDAAERHINDTVENMQQQIQWQRGEIDIFNASLPGEVEAKVAARRAALSQAADLAKKLSGK